MLAAAMETNLLNSSTDMFASQKKNIYKYKYIILYYIILYIYIYIYKSDFLF